MPSSEQWSNINNNNNNKNNNNNNNMNMNMNGGKRRRRKREALKDLLLFRSLSLLQRALTEVGAGLGSDEEESELVERLSAKVSNDAFQLFQLSRGGEDYGALETCLPKSNIFRDSHSMLR